MSNEEEEKIKSQIIQIAEQFYNYPDEFINSFEKSFENLPSDQKGVYFFYIARTLYDISYFDLALHSCKHALKYLIKNNNRYGESKCYIGLGNAYDRDFTKAVELKENEKTHALENRIREWYITVSC